MTDVKNNIVKFLKKTVSAERDEKGNTLLHYVVQTDNEEFIEYLIAAGCDVNAKNNFRDPPLAYAIAYNNIKATKMLLKAGANHDVYGLHNAAENGFYDIVEILIDFGADVNAIWDPWQETPLHAVTTRFIQVESDFKAKRLSDYLNVMKVLIDRGADMHAENIIGYTPLICCIQHYFIEGFELLISRGADINAGKTASSILFAAINTHRVDVIKRLLELGADIHATDERGNSLLHAAFMNKGYVHEIVEFLLDQGLTFDKLSNDGFDPLCAGIMVFIDGASRESNDDDHDDFYVCSNSVLSNHISRIDLAVKRGYDVNRVDNDGMTVLYTVLQNYNCHSEVLRVLLRHGATFDFKHPLVRDVMDNSNGSKFPLLLLRQAALFEAHNHSGGPVNFDATKLNKQSQKDYYASCQTELKLMKETKVKDTNFKFSDILFRKDISGYMRNELIVSEFEKQDLAKSFPIYSDLLIDRFSKELVAQKLVREAAKGLSHVLQWDEKALRVVLNNILSYVEEKDLKTLADI